VFFGVVRLFYAPMKYTGLTEEFNSVEIFKSSVCPKLISAISIQTSDSLQLITVYQRDIARSNKLFLQFPA
jgi:hypothetical protein